LQLVIWRLSLPAITYDSNGCHARDESWGMESNHRSRSQQPISFRLDDRVNHPSE